MRDVYEFTADKQFSEKLKTLETEDEIKEFFDERNINVSFEAADELGELDESGLEDVVGGSSVVRRWFYKKIGGRIIKCIYTV